MLNIKRFLPKKFLPYLIVFSVVFSISSLAMISLKKKIEDQQSKVFSKQLDKIKEKIVERIKQQDQPEQSESKDVLRTFKQLSPEEINVFLAELKQRIDLYEKKSGLLIKKQKEIKSFKADMESQKKELVSIREKLTETLLLVSKERVALDNDLIVFDKNERKNLKRLGGVYSSMEASKSAVILSQLNSKTGAKILSSMPSKKAAIILTEIDPTEAAKLIEQMRKLEIMNKKPDESLKQKNLKKLAIIYQGMEADKAVSIIEKLDGETTINILSYMDEKKLAGILEFMEAEEASKLSEEIRNVIRKREMALSPGNA